MVQVQQPGQLVKRGQTRLAQLLLGQGKAVLIKLVAKGDVGLQISQRLSES